MRKSHWSLLFWAVFHMCVQCILMIFTPHYLVLLLPALVHFLFPNHLPRKAFFFPVVCCVCVCGVFYNGVYMNTSLL